MSSLWTVSNNFKLGEIEENVTTSISLPLENNNIETKLISGQLPLGLRLENNQIKGTPFEVDRPTTSTFVIRAEYENKIADRTFFILVQGADEPRWITNEGRLPIGSNGTFFILDNSLIDFQLLADDPDIPAGDQLEFRLTRGELPPGINLSLDGRLQGIIDPILAIDVNVVNGNYDINTLDVLPFDFGFDVAPGSRIPRKLNREYFFTITVYDNVSSVSREFRIFVVGDDFARADNTIMKAADGVFTADFTFLRVPIWLTPSNLGVRRANNYITIFLDAFDANTFEGELIYILEPVNDDGSDSALPPGMSLDPQTGEVAGRVPYQPAVTRDYKFTINAFRFNERLGLISVFGTFLDDTLANTTNVLRIGKIPRIMLGDLTELQNLVGREITIENRSYTVVSVDENDPEFDLITLDRVIEPIQEANFLRAVDFVSGNNHFFVETLTEFDRNFYLNRELRYSSFESYRINDLYPYIEWEISANGSPIYLKNNGDSTLLEPILEDQFKFEFRNAYVTVERNNADQAIKIIAKIPATAQNRNRTFIKSFFEAEDSSDIELIQLSKTDQIILDNPISGQLTNDLNMGKSLALSVLRGGNLQETFSRLEEEVAFKKKTFNIRMIGEVDSVITWLTPSNLGTLEANRISTLFVKAQTTVTDSVIRYQIIDGELPFGLKLNQDGEIIGKVPSFGTVESPGLLRFVDDGDATTFDFGTTTFDREYTFTVLAKDRFEFSAIERTFTIKINDDDNLNYSNIIFRPYLKPTERQHYLSLLDNARIFEPSLIYRPSDRNFGIQKEMKCFVYAGIENLDLEKYITAVSKNHKRKSFYFGNIKTAVAKNPGSNEIIYEVVYVEVIDRAASSKGIVDNLNFKSNNSITIDSTTYENPNDNELLPYRYRPKYTNPITADTTAISMDQTHDNKKYLSNINTMRNRIRNISYNDSRAITNRDFLPLWMRTPQGSNLNELGYVLAVPIVYTKPGQSLKIKQNIENSNFDFKKINFDIDRYEIDNTKDVTQEQYILFANYQFNV